MTRETKIGLLVGLAFIIVIGILLSDHLTSSTEPPSATLVQAGSNIRQQVATPGGSQAPIAPVTPSPVVPTQTIVTQRDLNPPTAPTAVVQVGGPVTTAKPPELAQTSTPAEPPVTMTPPTEVAATNNPTATDPQSRLTDVASQHGEPLVALNGGETTSGGQSSKPAQSAGKDYIVQPGDTLSKLANKFLGSASKANRDAIVKANPSLAADPNKLIVGKTYKIPAHVETAAAPAAVPAPIAALPAAKPVEMASAGGVGDFYYTVKPGDSLWKISNDQLGKGGAGVAALKELNKDVLNGSETVQVDMKLRLPGKPLN